MDGWNRNEGMCGWMEQRKERSSRQTGRQKGRTEGGWCPPAPTALIGWADVGQSGTAPRNSPRAAAVSMQQCCRGTGAAPMALRTRGTTALQQLELMSVHYNCAHGLTTIGAPGHVSMSQLCTQTHLDWCPQWCPQSPGSPEAMPLVSSPCHSHACSLLVMSGPGNVPVP